MNEWDRDNLKFLLTADEAEFADWFAQATRDDVDYALSLFALYRNELAVKEMEVRESEEQDLDCTEALSFINRVKEKL